MTNALTKLHAMRRPRLLIRSARIGADSYRRQPHLSRLFGGGAVPRSDDALHRLIELETEMNEQHRQSGAGYSAARHVELLIAIMGEARLLQATQRARIDA